jgi:hypothetical protein
VGPRLRPCLGWACGPRTAMKQGCDRRFRLSKCGVGACACPLGFSTVLRAFARRELARKLLSNKSRRVKVNEIHVCMVVGSTGRSHRPLVPFQSHALIVANRNRKLVRVGYLVILFGLVCAAGRIRRPYPSLRYIANRSQLIRNGSKHKKYASSEEFVGDGERQRAASARNRWNFLQVESKDLC